MSVRTLLISIVALVLLYFGAGAWVLRSGLDRWVLPRVGNAAPSAAPFFLHISSENGNEMSVRRHGTATAGCVVFFPGQPGLVPAYEKQLFPAFSAQGISVLAVAYPGQDGATGTAKLDQILALATQVADAAEAQCPNHRVVIYGRSLGAMVAAYVAGRAHPAGLILESAAPSLSSAIRIRLSARWYLAPMTLLPVSRLLAHDYSLTEALAKIGDVPSVVFQGTADSQTPLSALRAAGLTGHLRVMPVSGGTHSTTDILAREQMVQAALAMLQAPRP